MTITAPQGSIPFVDTDRTPSNTAMILLQQLRNTALNTAGVTVAPSMGAGGTVTQLTSITTAVTLNTYAGQITTLSNAWTAGFANSQSFTVTNSKVAAVDCIIANATGAAGNYICFAGPVAAGSFQITLVPLVNATETVTVNFMVLKSTIN